MYIDVVHCFLRPHKFLINQLVLSTKDYTVIYAFAISPIYDEEDVLLYTISFVDLNLFLKVHQT